jgi:hypothetical protein
VLSVVTDGENVCIELKTGPGKVTNTGAITPNGKPDVEVNVGFKLFEARRMAASVLAYLHAWDVMRMMCHHGVMTDRHMVSRPAAYLLVPATSAANGVQHTLASDAPGPEGAVRPSVVAATGNDRLVVHDPVTGAKRVAAKRPHGRPAKPNTAAIQLLKYGDGSMVDGQNLTEVQTFQRYMAEKKAAPESKAVLLDYYRQQVQTVASQ